MASRQSGAKLAARWGLNVGQALYREAGDWYHQLRVFPGALLDAHGYIIFLSVESYLSCPHLQIRKDLHVPGGIRGIPGYVEVVPSGGEAGKQGDKVAYLEGDVTEVLQTVYERDPQARRACLSLQGYTCCVCGINFEERYGELGRGYIHVHHLEQIALANGQRTVDPATELVPVCPNCHAMLHRRIPPLSPAALRAVLRRVDHAE